MSKVKADFGNIPAREESVVIMNPNKRRLTQVIIFFIVIIFAIFALIPFYFLIISSFKSGADIVRYGISLDPNIDALTFNMYWKLFFDPVNSSYFIWYGNSLLYTFVHTVLALIVSSCVGYALGIYKFKGDNAVFMLVLLVMMLPIEIMMLPLFRQMMAYNMIDSMWGVILPYVAAPMSIFFFRQYSLGLPKELMEAGRIDGLTEYGIFVRIMVPLMKPAFGAMSILIAMSSWNAQVWPMIILRSSNRLTLPAGFATLITPYNSNYDLLFPGAVLAIIPIVIVFLLNQKAFISGLTVGSIKG